MATDRIGIGGHGTCEVAGALMSSGTKRKVEELGGHVVSAVVGGVVDLSMSAAVARYEVRTSVDDQLDRLRDLSITVHCAVEAAEGVHIRSWWLRRWVWNLRDAALDGDEVLQLFRQRRTVEETDAASRRNMVWRALRSAKSLLFGRGDDDHDRGVDRLSRVVARLEREAVGLGDFLKMLELEMRRPALVQRPARPVKSAPQVQVPPMGLLESDHTGGGALAVVDEPDEVLTVQVSDSCVSALTARAQKRLCCQSAIPAGGDGSRLDHGLSSISHKEYVAGVRKIGLLIVRRRIQRVLDRLIRKKPAATPSTPDTDRIRELVACIRLAIVRPSAGSANLNWISTASGAGWPVGVSVLPDRDGDVADVRCGTLY